LESFYQDLFFLNANAEAPASARNVTGRAAPFTPVLGLFVSEAVVVLFVVVVAALVVEVVFEAVVVVVTAA
jgi:hypothetical protein